MAETESTAPPRRLYLAYGSNLSREQMRHRCPTALALEAVIIPGWRLGFLGELSSTWGEGAVATMLPSPGHCALGMVYELKPDDEASLDQWEGVKRGHYEKREAFGSYNGEPLYSYICRVGKEGAPGSAYLATMRQGFHDWKLLLDPLNPLTLVK